MTETETGHASYWASFVESISADSALRGVCIQDPSKLIAKLEQMAQAGLSQFQVISDFDGTVTKHFNSAGKRCFSCHGVIGKFSKFSDAYRNEVQAMENRFGPKEKDPTISDDERLQLMHDWWAQSHALMIAQNISISLISEMVADAIEKDTFGVRGEFRKFALTLREANVPTVVLSAGISIVIEKLFEKENIPVDKLTMVVSNQTVCDPHGVLAAFVEPILHGLSKKHVLKSVIDVCEDRKSRTNYLVLGDMPHDCEVVDLLHGNDQDSHDSQARQIVSIGFLMDKTAHLSEYMDIYDVVLTDDQGFKFACDLFQALRDRAQFYDTVQGSNPLV